MVVTEPGPYGSEESPLGEDWLAEFTEMAQEIEKEDFAAAEAEIQAHRSEAKQQVAEEMAGH